MPYGCQVGGGESAKSERAKSERAKSAKSGASETHTPKHEFDKSEK